MNSDRFIERLKIAISSEKNLSAFARKAGISEGLLRGYLKNGMIPKLDTALAIASAAGVSLDWLVGESDEKQPNQKSPHETLRSTISIDEIDPELLGRVIGMVESVYKLNNITLSTSDAARIAAPYYSRLQAITNTGTEDERLALLGLLKAWLEKDIAATASGSGTSKASA